MTAVGHPLWMLSGYGGAVAAGVVVLVIVAVSVIRGRRRKRSSENELRDVTEPVAQTDMIKEESPRAD